MPRSTLHASAPDARCQPLSALWQMDRQTPLRLLPPGLACLVPKTKHTPLAMNLAMNHRSSSVLPSSSILALSTCACWCRSESISTTSRRSGWNVWEEPSRYLGKRGWRAWEERGRWVSKENKYKNGSRWLISGWACCRLWAAVHPPAILSGCKALASSPNKLRKCIGGSRVSGLERPPNLFFLHAGSTTPAHPDHCTNSLDRHHGRCGLGVHLDVDDALGVGLAEARHGDGPPELARARQLVARPGVHAVVAVGLGGYWIGSG